MAVKTPAPERAEGRKMLAAKGQTLPGTTSFPTPDVAYWHKALQSVGRVPPGKRPALASYLKKRAKQLGIASHVKGTWLENSPAMASVSGPAVELVGPKGYEHGWIKVGVSEHDAPEEKADKMSANAFRRGDGTQDALQGHRDAAKAHRAAASLSSSPARSAYHAKMATLHSRVASTRMTSNKAEDQAHGLHQSIGGFANDGGKVIEMVGPGGWSHGWKRGEGVPENDFKPAPSMTTDELTRHLTNEHGGGPVPRSMRGTSRKAKGKAALVAHHEEMHRMLAAGSPAVNQGIGHSHGQHVSASLAGAHGKAIEMAGAMPRRMPKVRGAADVQLRRAGPGTITVQHKSSGMKVGTLAAKGRGWQGMHASGVKTPASGSQQGALAGLIAVHNRLAAGSKSPMAMVPAQQMGSAVAASSDAGKAVDLAGSLPVTTNASSSDGPRVTTAGGSGSGSSGSSGPAGLSPYAAALYKKFIAKGMKPAVAIAFAKRADAMHEKAAKAA